MSSVDETLAKLVSQGFPLWPERDKVHEGLKRLQMMLEREIDEAEALQAAGEWTFVLDEAAANDAAAAFKIESEDDHDD
ncbi:MAG TPA: hypothetical protein VFI31_15635 [Pirellulales bacterium]|nr:hypothetical protein [Pirellulales bacterium]